MGENGEKNDGEGRVGKRCLSRGVSAGRRVSACHPALDAGPRQMSLVVFLSQVFLNSASGRGMTEARSPADLWELSLGFPFLLREKKRKGFFHGLLSAGLYIAPRSSLYSASGCGVIPSLPRVQRGTEASCPCGSGIKKEPEGCLLLTSFRLYSLRWRLPTLPLAQYHRRDGA